MLKVIEIVDKNDGYIPNIEEYIVYAGEDISEAARALIEYLDRVASLEYKVPVIEWWYTKALNGDVLYIDNGPFSDRWSWVF